MFQFHDVIGQREAKEKLLREVHESRVAHAQLICGPAGCGKLPLALAYARYLCCTQHTADDACGRCPSCIKWNKLVHPDVYFMFPIVKNAKKKLETCDDFMSCWRHLLITFPYFAFSDWLDEMDVENGQPIIYARESDEMTRKLSLKSNEGGFRIIIVWLPEKMHEACANKLLKLLEEPPVMTVFLLVSEEPERILPTILSRTQRINLPGIDETDMTVMLQNRYGLSLADASSVAHQANGNLVQALETIRHSEENESFFQLFASLMRLSYQRKIREMKQWSEQLASMGRERQKDFLEYCQRMIRENFISNLHCPQMNYMTQAEQDFATKFAPFVNVRNVIEMMNELSEAQIHIEQNVNPHMVYFDFALKMIVLIKNK